MVKLGGNTGPVRILKQAPVGAQEGLQVATWITVSYAPPGLVRVWLSPQGCAKNGSTLGYYPAPPSGADLPLSNSHWG